MANVRGVLASCTRFSKRLYLTFELSEAHVQQSTIDAEGCGQGGDHVGNQPVRVGVGVIPGLVIHESLLHRCWPGGSGWTARRCRVRPQVNTWGEGYTVNPGLDFLM
jgi:hypothetical protein